MSDLIIPNWPAPAPTRVRALVTTRQGGVSLAPWASFNLGQQSGDDMAAVNENRRRLRAHLPDEPKWLSQVHGIECVDAARVTTPVAADASFSRTPGVVCAVLTADCLPVLFCADDGWQIAGEFVFDMNDEPPGVRPFRLGQRIDFHTEVRRLAGRECQFCRGCFHASTPRFDASDN